MIQKAIIPIVFMILFLAACTTQEGTAPVQEMTEPVQEITEPVKELPAPIQVEDFADETEINGPLVYKDSFEIDHPSNFKAKQFFGITVENGKARSAFGVREEDAFVITIPLGAGIKISNQNNAVPIYLSGGFDGMLDPGEVLYALSKQAGRFSVTVTINGFTDTIIIDVQ